MKLAHALAGMSLLILGVDIQATQAVDLTGTWTGKIVCNTFDATGTYQAVVAGDTMLITQSGADLNMTADGGEFTYDGKVIDKAGHPTTKGQASFIECRTTPADTDVSEIGRTKVEIQPDGVGDTFTAQSILSAGGSVFQTCRWSYKRLDTADPGVGECGTGATARIAPGIGHGR